MSKRFLFWDVDTQADFTYPTGKLYVPGAERMVGNLKRLTDWAAGNGILVIASACAHHADDAEFAQYPPHCLVGTAGQQKIPETRLPDALVVPNRGVELPTDLLQHQQIVIEKQQLDVFTNPNTETLLKRLGTDYEIVLYGVVSEICVARAARGLLGRGYQLRIVTDAIRHLDEAKAQKFLEEAAKSGAKLVTSSEVIAGASPQRAA